MRSAGRPGSPGRGHGLEGMKPELVDVLLGAWLKDTSEPPTKETVANLREQLAKSITDKAVVFRSQRVGINFAVALSQNLPKSGIEKIELYENLIRDKGCESLCGYIRDCPSLTHINLGCNDIGTPGVLHLCKVLVAHKKLQVVLLGSADGSLCINNIDMAGGKALAEALAKNKGIKHLDLNRAPLSKGGQGAFAEFAASVERHPSLHTLALGGTGMSSESAVELLGKLAGTTSLRDLDLHGNDLASTVAEKLAKLLSTKSETGQKNTLQRLHLHNNPRLGERAAPLFTAICPTRGSSVVTYLNVSNTGIQDPAIETLAECIHYSTTLQHLNLSHNYITAGGCTTLADAIASHPVLQHLNLSFNKVRCDGASALANALEHNQALTALELEDCRIADKGCIALGIALVSNRTLQSLRLCQNHISDEGGRAFITMLDKNPVLHSASLKGNQVDYSTILKLKNVLKRNKEARENEEPMKLQREVIRLHFQQCKLHEASQELKQYQQRRQEIADEIERHEIAFHTEKEEITRRIKEYHDRITRDLQEIDDLRQKKQAKEEEFQRKQGEYADEMERLERKVQEEAKKREEAQASLEQKLAEQRHLEKEREEEEDRLRRELQEKIEDTERWKRKAEEYEERINSIQAKLKEIEGSGGDKKPSSPVLPTKSKSIRKK